MKILRRPALWLAVVLAIGATILTPQRGAAWNPNVGVSKLPGDNPGGPREVGDPGDGPGGIAAKYVPGSLRIIVIVFPTGQALVLQIPGYSDHAAARETKSCLR